MQNLPYLLLRQAWWTLKDYPAQSVARLLAESQWWPREPLEDFRDEKIRKLIRHCYENVPYYRQIMDERGLHPGSIQSEKDLSKLPVLTKSDVRRNWAQLRAKNIADNQITIASTAGSTGEQVQIAKHPKANCWATMSYERGLSWVGLMPGMKRVVLMGGTLGSYKDSWLTTISHKFSGRIHLPALDLGPANAHEYANVIRKSKAQFLIGYASSIYDFARLLLERGEKLQLEGVFTTSERLYPEWAEVIRNGMQCKVYQYYGCGECNSVGFQCQQGATYHITEEHVIVEVQSDSGLTSLSGTGEALISDLDNYAMPLLRYQNGDYLTTGDGPCSCGRSLRLISRLEGRIREFLLKPTGERVSGAISTVLMRHVAAVREFQVRQESLDRIRVLVVPAKELTQADHAYIRDSFRYYLGNQLEIEIQQVEKIARTKAQKLQVVVNEML